MRFNSKFEMFCNMIIESLNVLFDTFKTELKKVIQNKVHNN
jgi:hypothetical protein